MTMADSLFFLNVDGELSGPVRFKKGAASFISCLKLLFYSYFFISIN